MIDFNKFIDKDLLADFEKYVETHDKDYNESDYRDSIAALHSDNPLKRLDMITQYSNHLSQTSELDLDSQKIFRAVYDKLEKEKNKIIRRNQMRGAIAAIITDSGVSADPKYTEKVDAAITKYFK